jgi:hypothetical protein
MDANNFCFKYFATGDKKIGMLEKDPTGLGSNSGKMKIVW